MKKIIASVILACFGASILIAEVPAAVAASDPFAGVEGVELTVVEEGEVEGEGFVFGAIVGGVSSMVVDAAYQKITTGKVDAKQVVANGVVGALGGAVGCAGSGMITKSKVVVEVGKALLGAAVNNAIAPRVNEKLKK